MGLFKRKKKINYKPVLVNCSKCGRSPIVNMTMEDGKVQIWVMCRCGNQNYVASQTLLEAAEIWNNQNKT